MYDGVCRCIGCGCGRVELCRYIGMYGNVHVCMYVCVCVYVCMCEYVFGNGYVCGYVWMYLSLGA